MATQRLPSHHHFPSSEIRAPGGGPPIAWQPIRRLSCSYGRMRYQFMNSGRTARLLLACLALALIQACSDASNGLTGPDASPPPSFAPVTTDSSSSAFPATGPSFDPSSPSLDLMITKSMLWAAAVKHNVNPYLV